MVGKTLAVNNDTRRALLSENKRRESDQNPPPAPRHSLLLAKQNSGDFEVESLGVVYRQRSECLSVFDLLSGEYKQNGDVHLEAIGRVERSDPRCLGRLAVQSSL